MGQNTFALSAPLEKDGGAKLLPRCRSRHVVAVLVAADGQIHVASNGVRRPRQRCPRKTLGYGRGEGWHLCTEICAQPGHAEIQVLRKAGDGARGATLYLHGHDCACGNCLRAMVAAGVDSLVILDGQKLSPADLLAQSGPAAAKF